MNKILITCLFLMITGGLMAQQTSTTFTVQKKPIATATPFTQSICAGVPSQAMVLGISNTLPAGTTFDWVRNALPGAVGTVTETASQPTSGTGVIIGGSIPTGTFTNTTGVAQDVTYVITPTSAAGCVGDPITATITVNPKPSSTAGAIANVNAGGTAFMTFTTTGTNYAISFAPVTTGLNNVVTTAVTNPITFPVGSNVPAGTYTATITVTNAAGCDEIITKTFTVLPTITPTNIFADAGGVAHETPYSVTGINTVGDFKINFTAAGNGAAINTAFIDANKVNGLFDNAGASVWVPLPSLDGTPEIDINVPSTVPSGVYTVDIYDKNTSSAIESAVKTFTITVAPDGTITGGAPICNGTSLTKDLTLTLSGTGPWVVVYNDGTPHTVNVPVGGSPYPITVNVPTNAGLTTSTTTYSITSITENGGTTNSSVGSSTNVDVYPTVSATMVNATLTDCEGQDITIRFNRTDEQKNNKWTYTYKATTPVTVTSYNPAPVAPENNPTLSVAATTPVLVTVPANNPNATLIFKAVDDISFNLIKVKDETTGCFVTP